MEEIRNSRVEKRQTRKPKCPSRSKKYQSKPRRSSHKGVKSVDHTSQLVNERALDHDSIGKYPFDFSIPSSLKPYNEEEELKLANLWDTRAKGPCQEYFLSDPKMNVRGMRFWHRVTQVVNDEDSSEDD
jgi:hypothetical protein